MPRGKVKPHCMYCEERRADWPPDRPMFCTIKCASLYAKEEGKEKEWCPEHREWYYWCDGCPSCNDRHIGHPALR